MPAANWCVHRFRATTSGECYYRVNHILTAMTPPPGVEYIRLPSDGVGVATIEETKIVLKEASLLTPADNTTQYYIHRFGGTSADRHYLISRNAQTPDAADKTCPNAGQPYQSVTSLADTLRLSKLHKTLECSNRRS